MTKQSLRNFAIALGLLGLALIPSTSVAQVGPASKLPGKNPATAAAQAASHKTKKPGSPSYSYTLLSFPGLFPRMPMASTKVRPAQRLRSLESTVPAHFSRMCRERKPSPRPTGR